jgi:tripartite-type tricarboxylate transporter receptor subunit TctC
VCEPWVALSAQQARGEERRVFTAYIVAPRATPRAAIERMHRETAAILRDASIARQLTSRGLEPIGDTPAEFAEYLRTEAAKWGKLVKIAGIKPE